MKCSSSLVSCHNVVQAVLIIEFFVVRVSHHPSQHLGEKRLFGTEWDCAAAVGVLDGKHVEIISTPTALAYDLGAPGRSFVAGVFGNSAMKLFLGEHSDDFPGLVQLTNIGKVEHHVLVDQSFSQTIRFFHPFNSADSISDLRKAYFNNKLSRDVSNRASIEVIPIFKNFLHRARRIVGNYFGKMTSRFRVYTEPIYADPDRLKNIVLAMILHNLLVQAVGVKKCGVIFPAA
ncbi:hypothetical protein Y032_0094g2758 [Ancylostoma ceylanicum]|uniref:DDE Tnp4 domain-containing protein n=1 Tax=Ancylostoma ceylanicum TaxID=53326 RepID=A0A016TL67_9BILA|nr:hypothetical protein Y032_0094g2758 [Ancylostoma ceylanicum]